MEEQNNNSESKIKAIIDSASELSKAIPIYQDVVQPSARQLGKSLETVSKTVNIALAPIKALVWGYDQIESFISTRVVEKLKNIPEENIITPEPQVAVPTVEALRYTGHDENLRELFANLLASAMNKTTSQNAHPSFVSIIKNLSSQEALLVKRFCKEYSFPLIDLRVKKNDGHITAMAHFSLFHKEAGINLSLVPANLDNLCRLGILEIPYGTFLTQDGIYNDLENDELIKTVSEYITNELKTEIKIDRKLIRLTMFGKDFIKYVVTNPE